MIFDYLFVGAEKFARTANISQIGFFWFFDPFLYSTVHTTEKIFDLIFEELIISVLFCDMRDPALIELPCFI